MKEVRLFTPGPTTVPELVRAELARPMIHHRSSDFSATLQSVREKLKTLCDTSGETVVFTSSGTGAMEASVAGLFSPGDEVLVVEGGKFAQRWTQLSKHYQLNVKVLSVEWGKAVKVEKVLEKISKKTKGLLIQGCETSTGVYHPIDEIGKEIEVKQFGDLLYVVDGITTLGIHPVSMDQHRIDVLIGGSQKALMCPPGLATVAMSTRAISVLEQLESKSYYLNLKGELNVQKKGNTLFTPALSLIQALDVALTMIEEQGKDLVFGRHRCLARMARLALKEIGLELFNHHEDAAWGLTTALSPKGVDVKKWLAQLKKEHGLWLAGGQAELSGKIFRLAHMGDCMPLDLIWAIRAIEDSLMEHYPNAKQRAGSNSAQSLWEIEECR